MPSSLNQHLAEAARICAAHNKAALAPPIQAFSQAVFPVYQRLEYWHISHSTHSLRTLDHAFAAWSAAPDTTPELDLALGLSCGGHDLSSVRKITSTDVASAEGGRGEEELRLLLRLRHEVEGAAEVIDGVVAANVTLAAAGHPPISSRTLETVVLCCVCHDFPSRRSPFPLRSDSAAGRVLRILAEADCINMIDFGDGLANSAPLGPMVEPWAKGQPLTREVVAKQALASVRSLRSRLQAAYGHPSDLPLDECFSDPVLRSLAVRYVAAWEAELGVGLRVPAGLA